MNPDVAFERMAQLIGCKWSVRILTALRDGPARPSHLLKATDGVAPKVLHRCLGRLQRDGLVQKEVLPEVPPHTEYTLTDQGREFVQLLDSARQIAQNWRGRQRPI